MIKFLIRMALCVIIAVVLVNVAFEVYLKHKGTEVSVGPMGIIFLYEESFIGDSYIYSDMEMPNGIRLNRLVTINTSYFLIKAITEKITGRSIKDSVLMDINGDGKVEIITTIKGEETIMMKGILPPEAVICAERKKLTPERVAVCESADEYFQNIIKAHSFKEKINAVRGKIKKKNKNEINL